MTPAQVRQRFENQRTEMVRFASETDLPLKQYLVDHPFKYVRPACGYSNYGCLE